MCLSRGLERFDGGLGQPFNAQFEIRARFLVRFRFQRPFELDRGRALPAKVPAHPIEPEITARIAFARKKS